VASSFVLKLSEDALEGTRPAALPEANRVLYVLRGEVTVEADGRRARVEAAGAWHGAGACQVEAGAAGATVLRYELCRDGAPAPREGSGVRTRLVLEHPIELEPAGEYLMRADRVDFAPGGVALPHRHRGGGIRCLIAGALEVRIGDGPGRLMTPGMAWFESGREPVLATASAEAPTSFIRVAILPREILGQTSILYVDPRDAERGKPRRYTVYVDAPIAIG
jgi:quercetin dioxygenase-like cupin family protein